MIKNRAFGVKDCHRDNLDSIFLCCNISALIPLSEFSEAAVMKKYAVKPDAETLDIANTAARKKSITVVMKIYWGDPREKICEAVEHIPLSSLVIGNRGLGGLKRMIMGSVSNHVVNNVACPVTVVKAHH
ncbi:hypothetical protein F2Q69_00003620 [Brassica cretica]|uniref:UspA domain-containing protein n=1 Tax=Brassica cretica TaxID=69181 RepID=A0A8S9NZU6_BRACR|nr:hypothetical protein F2Q69_00003620 [Brassica cretica]